MSKPLLKRGAVRQRDLSPYPSPEVGGAPGSTALNSTVDRRRCLPAPFPAHAEAGTDRRLISATHTPRKQQRRAPLPSQGRGRGLGPECNPTVCTFVLTLLALSAAHSTHAAEAPAFRTKFDREVVPGTPTLVSTRVQAGPQIDGEVDKDPVWQSCGRTHGAWTELGTKTASGRQTVVYTCHDRERLYLGFVCEEPELQNARFEDNDLGQGTKLSADDCVEAVLEVGGMAGDGQVFSFRANPRTRSTGWGFSQVHVKGESYSPEWKSAGKFGPNRWMVEMEIPFSSLKLKKGEKGMASPLFGDVLGLKLARYGRGQADPRQRLISTWNIQLPLRLLYTCGYNGLLYFGNTNVLDDANFSLISNASPWKRAGDVTASAGSGLVLNTGATLSQALRLRPSEYYLLTVESEGGALEAFAGDQKIELSANRGGFFAPKDSKQWLMILKAAARVQLRQVCLQLQPGEEPPGVLCLTNNYRRASRNLSAQLPQAPEGSYRYVKLNYDGSLAGDDHPTSAATKNWDFDPAMVVPDLGGESGYIPFSKGSLTGSPHTPFWQIENHCLVGYGRHEYSAIDIDLGQDYFVTGVDILWPAPYTTNVEIWGKPDGASDWTYLHTGDGRFVEPSRRRSHARGYERVRGLDSVVRHVRWRAKQLYPAYPQIDGIQEFWVWGIPKGTLTGVKPFQPWFDKQSVRRTAASSDRLDSEACQIVPRPRKLDLDAGWFVIDAQTRIVVQDHAEARKLARQIHAEILERWQIDLALTDESAAVGRGLQKAIYLGQPGLSQFAAQAVRDAKLELQWDKPQSYALRVTPKRITVTGRDNDGLYYGVQSLMMGLRWRNGGQKDVSGPAIRCMAVQDWPGTLERAFAYNSPRTLNLPFSQLWRLKRMCQILSRFKFNAFYLSLGRTKSETASWQSDWPAGALTQLCREVREEYHLELRPMLLGPEGQLTGGWWWDMAETNQDFSIAEVNPDEKAVELGSMLNVCPLEPKTYDQMFETMDRTLAAWDSPSRVWLWGQAYSMAEKGARWAVCRRCQQSGRTPAEIYVHFLERVAEHLKERQTTGLLNCPFLCYGQPSSNDSRLLTLQIDAVPQGLLIDLAPDPLLNAKKPPAFPIPNLDKALQDRVLDPARTFNGAVSWPSVGRYKGGGEGAPAQKIISELVEGSAGAEEMWYAPDRAPEESIDIADLSVWLYSRWYRWDFPSWRAGERPSFVTLDLRKVATLDSHPTGAEMLQPGRLPAVDLRNLPTGKQTLAGVPFDIIDPAENGRRSILAVGRPPQVAKFGLEAVVVEQAGPVLVGRPLASLCFLHTLWECVASGIIWPEWWLRPSCRVIYDDGSWLIVDSFYGGIGASPLGGWQDSMVERPYERLGWHGYAPNKASVRLLVTEWLNPYPEKTIKQLEFHTPAFESRAGKRVNPQVQVFVAITGVEAVEQDFVFWRARKDRPPLLTAPQAPVVASLELKPPLPLRSWYEDLMNASVPRYGTVNVAELKPSWQSAVKTAEGSVSYSGKLLPSSVYYPYGGLNEGVVAKHDFVPFGAELTFEKAVRLCRVEVLGPRHNAPNPYSNFSPRFQKVDVALEITEDGQTWRKAGELRGLSGAADFQPIDFPPVAMKGLRLVGNAAAYQESYHPRSSAGAGMFNTAALSPHFNWRLFGPDETKK